MKKDFPITYQGKPPFEFLSIGKNPIEKMNSSYATEYDIFLNVTESVLYSNDIIKPRKDTIFYHVPIEEGVFWGYEPILKTKIILDDAFDKNKSVYLHCHSGAFRSPIIGTIWIYSKIRDMFKACEKISDTPKERKEYIEFYQSINWVPSELDVFFERYDKFGNNLEKILNTEPIIRNDLIAQ